MEIVEDTLPVSLESVLERPLFCHLGTTEGGVARVSPLWFLWEDQSVWIIADTDKTYPDRVRRNPRVALAIVDFDAASGRVHHVGMRGHARIEPFDEERVDRLLRQYLGADRDAWDPRFTGPWDDRWRWLRVDPDTVVARDQSYTVECSQAIHSHWPPGLAPSTRPPAYDPRNRPCFVTVPSGDPLHDDADTDVGTWATGSVTASRWNASRRSVGG